MRVQISFSEMFGPRVDQRSVETVEMPRIGSTQTIDTTDSSLLIYSSEM